MTGNDWNRKQNLVLDQCVHIHVRMHLDGVTIFVLKFLFRDFLAGPDQPECAFDSEWPLHRSQTTLTLQAQHPACSQLEQHAALLVDSPVDAKFDFTFVTRQACCQPGQGRQADTALQAAVLACKTKGIRNHASLRHKGGMILSPARPVKGGLRREHNGRRSARTTMNSPMKLVLASTSPYRRMLLERFGLPFLCEAPAIDEQPLPGEAPAATASRLALTKARAVAGRHPDALIIGSDQVAHLDTQVFGKPGTRERAIAQLQQMRGRSVLFHTAVALLDSRNGQHLAALVPTEVRFRALDDDEIIRYVDAEQPFDCAGSAKVEGLGITLLDALSGNDPTALIGLPLIALSQMLRQRGVLLP